MWQGRRVNGGIGGGGVHVTRLPRFSQSTADSTTSARSTPRVSSKNSAGPAPPVAEASGASSARACGCTGAPTRTSWMSSGNAVRAMTNSSWASPAAARAAALV